jgi:hypothetical protein
MPATPPSPQTPKTFSILHRLPLWWKLVFIPILILFPITIAANILAPQLPPDQLCGTPETPNLLNFTPTPDPTADWQTYTDEKHQISIKYPKNITIEVTNIQDSDLPPSTINLKILPGKYPFNIWAKEKTSSNNLQKLAQEALGTNNHLSLQNVNIGNSKALNAIDLQKGHQGSIPTYKEIFIIERARNLTFIRLFYEKSTQGTKEKELFDRILSTFRFLDQEGLTKSPSAVTLASITLTLSSSSPPDKPPAELLVTDPQGRRTGTDPQTTTTYNEIPKGYYDTEDYAGRGEQAKTFPQAKQFTLSQPTDGNYTIQVFGIGSGNFTLDILTYDDQGNPTTNTLSGEIAAGKVITYQLTFSSAPGSQVKVVKLHD